MHLKHLNLVKMKTASEILDTRFPTPLSAKHVYLQPWFSNIFCRFSFLPFSLRIPYKLNAFEHIHYFRRLTSVFLFIYIYFLSFWKLIQLYGSMVLIFSNEFLNNNFCIIIYIKGIKPFPNFELFCSYSKLQLAYTLLATLRIILFSDIV